MNSNNCSSSSIDLGLESSVKLSENEGTEPGIDPNYSHDELRLMQRILSERLKMIETIQQLNESTRSKSEQESPFLKFPPTFFEAMERQNKNINGEEQFLKLRKAIRGMESVLTEKTNMPTDHTSDVSSSGELALVESKKSLWDSFFEDVWSTVDKDWPHRSIPIRTDVTTFEWERLARFVQFDVVMMDPPWQLASSNPTRGVALGYAQLSDSHIEAIPMDKIARPDSFLFLWVINAKYPTSLSLIEKWGYTFVDEITWVKHTINRRLAKSHGFYLQHAKEQCLVAVRGKPKFNRSASIPDLIFSSRRGQSQKPNELYSFIEELIPGGNFLEIFGRKNNLRSGWMTIGNEI